MFKEYFGILIGRNYSFITTLVLHLWFYYLFWFFNVKHMKRIHDMCQKCSLRFSFSQWIDLQTTNGCLQQQQYLLQIGIWAHR